MPRPTAHDLMTSRWRGERGTLEVWYTTLTDPETGTGVWLHHELVAPAGGGPRRHEGWIAVFPPDGPPEFERIADTGIRTGIEVEVMGAEPLRAVLSGATVNYAWHLEAVSATAPLLTFPAWSWRRPLLPNAQVVPLPSATYHGYVLRPGGELMVANATGATARVYGRGHASRWSWLHADLGGGDVLEVVSGVPSRGPLRHLPQTTVLRLRHAGREWPAFDSVLCAPAFRHDGGFPEWSVSGRVGRRRLRAAVRLDPASTLAVDYTGPDGGLAQCRNSERADAEVLLEDRVLGRWQTTGRWTLRGTAHAEVGERVRTATGVPITGSASRTRGDRSASGS